MKKYLSENSKLVSEWHPTKNGDLRPEHFTHGSGKEVWWKCPKGDDHEWKTRIYHRSYGKNCPFCAGRKVGKFNNLRTLKPDLVSEWHPTKNGDLRPEHFTQYSGKKVWWKCSNYDDHVWEATISSRSSGRGCSICSRTGTSKPEIRVLCELRYLLGSDEVAWRSRVHGVEIDIFLPKYYIGIEYDGFYWHKDKYQSDLEKNDYLQKKGIQLLRIREKGLKIISKNDVVFPLENFTKKDLNALMLEIKLILKSSQKINFDNYIENSDFLNEEEFKRFLSFLPSPPPEFSIMGTHPKISKQWHYEKNSPLLPENFTYGNHKKFWWKCSKGDDHEWEMSLSQMCLGYGCPFCSGKRASRNNNLLKVNKKLASEWHPTKNGDLRPEQFTQKSGKKLWWKCAKGDDHEWQATINARNLGTGCPFCVGLKISKTNNLLILNPKLAGQWHPTKNGDLRPEHFTPSSNKRFWWKCPKGADHEWLTTIADRSRGSGCPFCSGKKVGKLNNLLVINPKLASEWHPTKNGDLRPENVRPGSHKRVWWKCPKGDDHEWDSDIGNRSTGFGCPFCSGRRACITNNLLILNPKLASEWHPTKNGDLRPEQFTQSSGKKVWWKCPKGADHEWLTTIDSRRRGTGCPFCSGRRACITNNLLILNPKLAGQWHPTKNGDLRPEHFTPSSSKRFWWKCPKEENHEWQAIISDRSRGRGCPFCVGRKKINKVERN